MILGSLNFILSSKNIIKNDNHGNFVEGSLDQNNEPIEDFLIMHLFLGDTNTEDEESISSENTSDSTSIDECLANDITSDDVEFVWLCRTRRHLGNIMEVIKIHLMIVCLLRATLMLGQVQMRLLSVEVLVMRVMIVI